MTRRFSHVLAAVVAASTLALVTACSAHGTDPGPPPRPAGSATAEPAPTSSIPTPTPTAGTVRLEGADGGTQPVTWIDPDTATDAHQDADYSVISTIGGARTCGVEEAPGALFDDGAWFAGVRPQETCTWQGGEWLPASYRAGVIDTGSTAARLFPSTEPLVRGDHPRQVTRSTVDGTTAVWGETDSTNLYFDNWRVFAADRTTGTVHLVARAEEFTGGKDLPFFEATYAIHGDRVYWSTTPAEVAGTQKTFLPEVVAKAISGNGSIAVVAKDASEPVATDQGVVVRTYADVDALDQGDNGDSTVVKAKLPTGLGLVTPRGVKPLLRIASDGPIDPTQQIDALAASGNLVAFAVGDTEYVDDLATGTVTGFRGAGATIHVSEPDDSDQISESTQIHSSAVGADLVIWTFGGGSGSLKAPAYVYNPADHELRRIWIEHNSGDVYTAKRFVGWRNVVHSQSRTTLVTWR